MKLTGEKMKRFRKLRTLSIILVIVTSFFLMPLGSNFFYYHPKQFAEPTDFMHSSGETVYNREWLKNNDFSTQDEWFYNKGAQGDNSTTDANISNGNANYIIIGEDSSFSLTAGDINSSSWYGWGIYNNGDYLLPDVTEINSTGCYVHHYLDEAENGGAGQVHNFPSVHFRKNISMQNDMTDFEITSANLQVFFNASVNANVDAPGDIVGQSSIFDSATFYIEIADLGLSFPFRVAAYKTSTLGQDSPPILTITDQELTYVSENDLITALNLALKKDPNHTDFTIIMGIDIYCEDNDFPDYDLWNYLIYKSFNLTFNYIRKVDQFSSVSWNQIGNTISGSNIQISDANLKFRYRIDQLWPGSLSPFSEIKIIINNNEHPETIRLSSASTSWQDAKVGGFDVTNLILKDVNISVSLRVFIANTFSLNNNITISIDDVYLNITYIETFADYETKSQLFLENLNKTSDPFIQVPLGETVNITIKYMDNLLNHILGADVQLSGKISYQLNENGPLEQYSKVIDTTELGIGIWSLTVTAQMTNYETQVIPFFVDVVERDTDLQMYVDEINKTLDKTFNIIYNQDFNITIFYRDDLTNQHLSGANVTITGFGDLTENNEQYTIILNSNVLNLGFNVLTINAQSENSKSQMIQLYVEVFERATEFELLVNNNPVTNIQIEVNQILNLTVFYRDDITKAHLSGAVVTLLTEGNFTEIGNQYNYTLNSTDLNLGFNVLSITAQFGNHESQSIQIYVEVYKIATNLTLLVDNSIVSATETIQVEVNQIKNFTVYYRNNITQQHISGAIVSLDWDNFTEIGSQYFYNLDTNDQNLKQGITVVTIEAQFSNYQSQTIQIYIEVTERDTVLEVYVDKSEINATQTISRDVNQVLNITVFYRDDLTSQHLSNASLTVRSNEYTYFLDETGNQYNYSLNTNDPLLGEGITIVTIIAILNNYQPRSFQFYIKVSKRASDISLYLNSDPKTIDPVLSLTFGKPLNITVLYSDNLTHISGATVRLINKNDPTDFYDLSEYVAYNQYTLLLDTSVLKVGVNLFTIIANRSNYQTKTLSLRITLNKISTVISTTTGERLFSIKPNEPFMLSIELNDVDFGGRITNAIVTYRWAYGQGNLTDADNNGIYEVELTNIPAGTYEIIITASAGDDYSFDVYRITISVETETTPDFTILFILLAGGLVALVTAFTLYQVRFKYPPLIRKSRKLRKKITKGKKTKPVKDITTRDDLIKQHLETIQLEKKPENELKEK